MSAAQKKKPNRDESAELAMASAAGDLKRVRRMLNSGVPPTKNAVFGAIRTAGEIQAESSSSRSQMKNLVWIVRLLFRAGLDPNGIEQRWGNTALTLAVQSAVKKIVSVVIQAGADLDAICAGRTALILAVCNDRPELVALLLKSGANVDAKDIYGCTALMEAVGRTKKRMAAMVAETCATFDASELLLHHRPRIVKLLLQGGANPRLKYKGETLLQIAKEDGDAAVVTALEGALMHRQRTTAREPARVSLTLQLL